MKRYVLTKDKIIYDTSKYIEDEDWGTCAFGVTGKYLMYYLLPNHTLIQKLGIIKQQSNNLIDLLEVGDMVEIKDEREDIDFDYIPMITEFDIKQGKAMNSPFSFASVYDLTFISSIYWNDIKEV